MTPSRLPARIGSVRVLERLGEGGMAFVHRGQDLFRPELPLAVKLLKPEAAADPELVRRFLREGEVLEQLSHPHLVQVHNHGRAADLPFLILELLPGGSIKRCKGEPPSQVIRRLLPVLEALELAHAAGVVHRDLKPSNLLFAGDGRLKVTDFGVCLWEGAEGTRATRSQMVVGTLGYMAPEQHGDPRRVDGRADVYALGAILYEFTAGQPWSQVQLPPAAVRPGYPPGLAGPLMQALAADPARRTPSMAALREQLAAWLESAAAAGWGEEALPGFSPEELEASTVAQRRAPAEEEPAVRLGPYLDALCTGGVGARRSAAEGLVAAATRPDESFLLAALARAPEGARFALAVALGRVGGRASLPALLGLLEDPFARSDAVEALMAVALREGCGPEILPRLQEPGLGSPWRWGARAALGDRAWVEALRAAWGELGTAHRLQALEAARRLPTPLRAQVREDVQDASRAGGRLQEAWEGL